MLKKSNFLECFVSQKFENIKTVQYFDNVKPQSVHLIKSVY